MKRKRLVSLIIVVCVVLILSIILAAWRESVLSKYISVSSEKSVSDFLTGQEDIEVLEVFSDPEELRSKIGNEIDQELFESYLVSYSQSFLMPETIQVTYLCRIKSLNELFAVSEIHFDSVASAKHKFQNSIDSTLWQADYLHPMDFHHPEEIKIYLPIPSFRNRGYSVHNMTYFDKEGEDELRGFWFDDCLGIEITVSKDSYEFIREKMISYYQEEK